jgi:hypothetical protein
VNADVRRFLQRVPGGLRPVVRALRRLVLEVARECEESVVWGSPSYHLPELGGRVKGAVCLITPRSDHVELGFIHGILLPDREHLLTGSGRSKRIVRVRSTTGLGRLAELIGAAVAVRPTAGQDGPRPSPGSRKERVRPRSKRAAGSRRR